MMCGDCFNTIKGDALQCRCGWKVPPRGAPVVPAVPTIRQAPTVRSEAEIARMRAVTARCQPTNPKAWAHKLLERAERGESVSQSLLADARRVAGSVPQVREPGSDDDMVAA